MKQVIQLDANGYFAEVTEADESPLEPGVYLLPAGCIDVVVPTIPEGQKAKWDGEWLFENILQNTVELTYAEKRAAEYPSFADQFDLLYHGGYDAWRAAIQVIKNKYPK